MLKKLQKQYQLKNRNRLAAIRASISEIQEDIEYGRTHSSLDFDVDVGDDIEFDDNEDIIHSDKEFLIGELDDVDVFKLATNEDTKSIASTDLKKSSIQNFNGNNPFQKIICKEKNVQVENAKVDPEILLEESLEANSRILEVINAGDSFTGFKMENNNSNMITSSDYDDDKLIARIDVGSTVFIEDSKGKTRLAFNIQITSSYGVVNRPRRISEFRKFDKECRAGFPDVNLEPLPAKLTFGLNRNRKIIESRRVKIVQYLRRICDIPSIRLLVADFLAVSPGIIEEVSLKIKVQASRRISAILGQSRPLNAYKKSQSLFSKRPVAISPSAIAAAGRQYAARRSLPDIQRNFQLPKDLSHSDHEETKDFCSPEILTPDYKRKEFDSPMSQVEKTPDLTTSNETYNPKNTFIRRGGVTPFPDMSELQAAISAYQAKKLK